MPGSDLSVFHHRDFDPSALVDAKAGQRIAVCLPARNEEATVGAIVEVLRRDLVDNKPLIDELVVINDHSTDDTAGRATAAGARVIDAATTLSEFGEGSGKGGALWKSMFATTSDLIVWCDSDIRDFDASFVTGLVGPLLSDAKVGFVKGFYQRPLHDELEGGGRVTELVARPLISLLFPDLAQVIQPLAGEYAGRRRVLERLPFVRGYGVDLGLLIDVAAAIGIEAMAQVDLGTRVHRNRSLHDLGPQAMAVMQTAMVRSSLSLEEMAVLVRPGLAPAQIDVSERPAPADVAAYGRRDP